MKKLVINKNVFFTHDSLLKEVKNETAEAVICNVSNEWYEANKNDLGEHHLIAGAEGNLTIKKATQ